MNWKLVLLRAAGFGAGFAFCLAILGGIFYWHSHRPKPWNNTALKASFAGMGFHTRPEDPLYDITLDFDIENTTSRDYEFRPGTLKVLALTSDGNVLSKEFGNYQSGEATLDGPSFIPSHSKARVTLHLSYLYPDDFTAAQKNDPAKVAPSVGRRLNELNGCVVFDETHAYRIDLPAGWLKWKDNLGSFKD